MTTARNYGLRELARQYYLDEMSFEEYRHQRRLLLDRVTGQPDGDITEPVTRVMADRRGATAAYHRARFWLTLFLLMLLVVTVLAVVWLTKPEWLPLPDAFSTHDGQHDIGSYQIEINTEKQE